MTERAEPWAWLCNGRGDGWEERDVVVRDQALVDRYRAQPGKWTVEPLYRGASALRAAEAKAEALTAALQEVRVRERQARRIIADTHKNAVKHNCCERPYCPICEGGLFVCADCGAAEVETEERVCTRAALSSPTGEDGK